MLAEVAAVSGVAKVGFSESVSSEQVFGRNTGMSEAENQSEEYWREGSRPGVKTPGWEHVSVFSIRVSDKEIRAE